MIDRSSPVKCNIFPIILSDAVGNTVFLTFQCSFFVVHAMLCGKSNMCLRNPLVTLCVSDCSRCGAVRIWRSLAQPSPHFGPVRSLSLWWGAHFEMARATLSALWACQIALVVARCSFWFMLMVKEILCRDLGELAQRSCTESSFRNFVQRALLWSLYRDLAKSLLQRSCQQSS